MISATTLPRIKLSPYSLDVQSICLSFSCSVLIILIKLRDNFNFFFVHVYIVHHFHFHFIDPTGALNINRNFNTIVLVSTLCFKTLQIFNLKTSFKTLVKTLVDHRRSSYMFRITCIHHQGVCIVLG
jgi:hypothetical protein